MKTHSARSGLITAMAVVCLCTLCSCEDDDSDLAEQSSPAAEAEVSLAGRWTGTAGSSAGAAELVLQFVAPDNSGTQVEGVLYWGDDNRAVVGVLSGNNLELLVEGGDEWTLLWQDTGLSGTANKWPDDSSYDIIMTKTDTEEPRRTIHHPRVVATEDECEFFPQFKSDSPGMGSPAYFLAVSFEQDGTVLTVPDWDGTGTAIGNTVTFSLEHRWQNGIEVPPYTVHYQGEVTAVSDSGLALRIEGTWEDDDGQAGTWSANFECDQA